MSESRDQSIQDVNNTLMENEITWVKCQFTDLHGELRSFTVPSSDFISGKLWRDGMTFDGSSVGFARTEDSDLRAIPDPETFLILPFGEGVQKVARIVTDTYTKDGSDPFPMDPRNAAKRTASQLGDMGFKTAHLQPELEFYLLRDDVDPRDVSAHGDPTYYIRPKGGYFASSPFDYSDEFRNEFTRHLAGAGLDIKFHHHEGGAQQVEVEFKHVEGVKECGDAAMLYKLLARLTAKKHGYSVSFMPKLTSFDSGNGMHVHMWLEGEKGSAFSDPDDEMGLTQTARYFIGGVIEHARGSCLFTNPTVNSYKRLIPEFEAPVYATWGRSNRTAMIRLPGSPSSMRVGDVEVRHSDTSCNPYLDFTVLLQAGMDGIKKKIEPPRPIDSDPNKMTDSQRSELGLKMLPTSLDEAIEAARSDDLIKRAVGPEIFDAFIDIKEKEVLEYRAHVSDWEIERYLSV